MFPPYPTPYHKSFKHSWSHEVRSFELLLRLLVLGLGGLHDLASLGHHVCVKDVRSYTRASDY